VMRMLVQISLHCPKHERLDPEKCTNCRLVEDFTREKGVIDARRESLLARIREAAKVKAIVISEIR
jgi:hypothetical protein